MKYLYIIVGLIAVNLLASTYYFRLDLTQEKRFTLADVTQEYLEELDSAVFVRLYLDGELNPGFTRLQRSTNEMLDEMRAYTRVPFMKTTLDPHEYSKAEFEAFNEKLADYNMAGVPVFETKEDGQKTRTVVYPYAMVQVGSKSTIVNLLENIPGLSGEENLNKSVENLEYKLIDAIHRLMMKDKPRVAFIEGQGELDEIDVVDVADALSEYFAVDRGMINGDVTILDPYKVVIIAKPTEKFTEADKYVLDQYLMRGGKILWFLDAVSMTLDTLRTQPQTIGLYGDYNIEDQLFVYGFRVNPVVVEDMSCARIPVSVAPEGQKSQIVPMPWRFAPLFSANMRSAITKNISLVRGDFSSSIDTVGAVDGLEMRRTPLLRTSAYTREHRTPVMATLMTIHDQPVQADFNKQHLPIAVLAEGEFKSAFTHRPIPSAVRNSQKYQKADKSEKTSMIVVGDGDIIRNDVRFRNSGEPQITPLGYDEISRQTFGNKDFVVNAVQYLADEDGLMNLRNRTFTLRLLDKAKISEGTTMLKIMAIGIPILFVVIVGLLIYFYRRRAYSRKIA
ncbi:MAG: gliding motility-associated ABC transporter substrate-binding protein GldG [Bacteroidales bacterium]|nr:gliding motility-associated ABC transporter substrate-binding protein GldG [Bacteroidales bacterium]